MQREDVHLKDFHLADQDLLLLVDGELAPSDDARVQSHLAACWTCRARKLEIENSIAAFVRTHRQELDAHLPPSAGARALLKARLAELAIAPRPNLPLWLQPVYRLAFWFETSRMRIAVGLAAVAAALLVAGFVGSRTSSRYSATATLAVPNPNLTPGATVLADRGKVCREPGPNNKVVPAALRQRVFEVYGIRYAPARAYEVDYLITPALGGADDIRNLWPQSYTNTVWNAQVKDRLEDHLRELVCEDQLDLATAQHEIAANWIEAYKKYFHTDQP